MKLTTGHHHTAQGVIGVLIVAIGFVLFYKLVTNQQSFAQDPAALQNYALLSIVAMGFLIGLFFLVSKSQPSKAKKKKK